jgi:hypothetical protein
MWGKKIAAGIDSNKEKKLALIISHEIKKERPHLSPFSLNAFMKPVYEPVVELAIRYQLISRHEVSESERIQYLEDLLKTLDQLMTGQNQDPKVLKKGKILMLFFIHQICHAQSDSERLKFVRLFGELKENVTIRKSLIEKHSLQYSKELQNFQGGHIDYTKDQTETQLLLTAILNKPQKTVISYLVPPLKQKSHYGLLLKYAEKFELNLEIELNLNGRHRLKWRLPEFFEYYEAIIEKYVTEKQNKPVFQFSAA